MDPMRRWLVTAGIASCVLGMAACHREVEMIPLIERTIYLTDRFYDVDAISADHAVVVGYGGKILVTRDGGRNWTQQRSGTDLALYGVQFADADHGWIVGQEGLILRTVDGGATWTAQESNATFTEPDGTLKRAYLFDLDVLDANTAWAVGDRSILVSTTDGGKTWRSRKVQMQTDLSGGQSLAAADPILYDIDFVDARHGWIVGEFGKVLFSDDGGESWREDTPSLMEGTEYIDLLDLPTLFGVFARDPQHAVAAGLEAHIARTQDGRRWRYDPVDPGGIPLVDPLYAVAELPNGTAWSVGAAGTVVRKTADTATWTRAQIGQDVLTWLRAVDFADATHGWMVGGFGLIFRTTDGGATWLPSQG